MKFAEALVFLKREWSNKFELNEEENSELSEYLKGKENYKHKKISFVVFPVVKKNLYIEQRRLG